MSRFKDMAMQPSGSDLSGPRTDYRCAAHGCPNAGCMDDKGPGTGKCFFHWTEEAPIKWPAITQKIRETWPQMTNHGPWIKRPDTAVQREIRKGMQRGTTVSTYSEQD